MFIFAKAMLYFCFSILIGSFILFSVPTNARPTIHVSRKWLLILIALVPLFGMSEILRLTLYLGEDIGYWISFKNILLSFEVGKGWMFLTAIDFILFLMVLFNEVKQERFFSGLALVLLTGMALAQGFASHAATLSHYGIYAHTLHFLAVSTWAGVLVVSGFFGEGKGKDFQGFYRWFTPLAFISLIAVIGAGLWLMRYIVPEYVNSFMMDYGQALLIKHVLLVVIVLYSLINGIWVKKSIQKDPSSFPVLKWIKAEAILLLFVFITTAVMTQETPPHDVAKTLQMEKPSTAFTVMTGLKPGNNPDLLVQWSMASTLLLVAFLFLAMLVVFGVKKNLNLGLGVLISCLAAFTLYLTVMFSVTL